MRTNVILLLAFMAQLSYGQEFKSISLSEIKDQVAQNNLDLKLANQSTEISKAEYQQTNAAFLPSVSISHTGISTTNPLMAFGSKLNQAIVSANDFNPDFLNDPDQTTNFQTLIAVAQPILNLDAVQHRKAAKNKFDATELQLQRTQDYIDLSVERAYMELQIAYEYKKVLEHASKTMNENLQMAKNHFEAGYMQKADVLEVEIEALKIKDQIVEANNTIKVKSDAIYNLMGQSSQTLLKPKEALTLNAEESGVSSLNLERSDLMAMEVQTKAYEHLYNASKMNFVPRINAFGNYELYDDAIFQTSANGYTFGISMSWNLFNGYQNIGNLKKSKVLAEKATTEYEQYKLNAALEFEKTKDALELSKNKLKTANLAVEQATEAYRIRKNRYEEGLEKTSDLLQSETLKLQKNLEYLKVIFEFNFTQSYLQFLKK